VVLIQVVGAILLILGSFLVLRALALAEASDAPGPSLEPQLRLVRPQPGPPAAGPASEDDWRQAA
jgi:hypothetical protein